jgi:hypothetical protein
MSMMIREDAACHESGHAVALAVRAQILTDNIYVGCKPDGTYAAGINDASRIPIYEMTADNWMVYNFAGHAAERLFNPSANRHTALQDDINAEKCLRTAYHHEDWEGVLDSTEQMTNAIVDFYRTCILELADAVLAVPPRAALILGEDYQIYRLSAPQVAQVLSKHGIRTTKHFETPDPDAMFEKLLTRYVTAIRNAQRSSVLADEFRNWRRFSEMKYLHPTTPALNHQMWLEYFGAINPDGVVFLDW